MKQRLGNSEEVILHMTTCWVDPLHIGGTKDCVFYDCCEITLFTVGEGPHLLAIMEQTMDFDQTKCAMFFHGHNNEFIMIQNCLIN